MPAPPLPADFLQPYFDVIRRRPEYADASIDEKVEMLKEAYLGDLEARGYDALLEWISTNWTDHLWRAQISRLEERRR